MELNVRKINELKAIEFLEIAKERVKVFVVEQNCPYQEIDDEDEVAYHVFLKDGQQITAYTRIIDRGEHVTFGRVLVVNEYRGKGLGKSIVEMTLNEIERIYPNRPVKISAQNYLVDFYGEFGFKVVSDVYLEDDIPHIDMLLEK